MHHIICVTELYSIVEGKSNLDENTKHSKTVRRLSSIGETGKQVSVPVNEM